MEYLLGALGLALGALLGFLWGRARAGAETAAVRVTLATRSAELGAALEAIGERDAFLAESRKQLEDAFGNLAAQALEKNNERFLAQAKEKLETSTKQSATEFKKDKEAIETRLKEMGETLVSVRKENKSLGDNLAGLAEVTRDLGKESRALSTALRGSSQARGRWGETQLRNLVEIAGMSEHCDFSEQRGTGELRPDMVVRLPGGDGIPIDSKAPLSAYLDAIKSDDADVRRDLHKKHATALRLHVRELVKREYHGASTIAGAIDFTVLFLPGEPFLAAALEQDQELQDYALERRILLATPVTLFALLKTVGIYWRQQSIAENAQAVFDVAQEFYGRVRVFGEHLGKMGRGLGQAVGAYNSAVGSFETKVLPGGRRLEELKAIESAKTIASPEKVAKSVRESSQAPPPPTAIAEQAGGSALDAG